MKRKRFGTKASVLRLHEKLGNNLTVISFMDNKRTMTYSNLTLDRAFVEIANRSAQGNTCIICDNLPPAMTSRDIEDYKEYQLKIDLYRDI